MENKDNDSKKLLASLLIGGVIGAGALYCIHAAQNRKTPLLKKIGKTVSEVGEILENCGNSDNLLDILEDKIPKSADVVSNLSSWVDTGLTLWKQFKKG